METENISEEKVNDKVLIAFNNKTLNGNDNNVIAARFKKTPLKAKTLTPWPPATKTPLTAKTLTPWPPATKTPLTATNLTLWPPET